MNGSPWAAGSNNTIMLSRAAGCDSDQRLELFAGETPLTAANELVEASLNGASHPPHAHWRRWCDAQGVDPDRAAPKHLLAYLHLHRVALGWSWKSCSNRARAIDAIRAREGRVRLMDDGVGYYVRALRQQEPGPREDHPIDPIGAEEYVAMVTARPAPRASSIRLAAALHLGRRGLSLTELTDTARAPIRRSGSALNVGDLALDAHEYPDAYRALAELLALPGGWCQPGRGRQPASTLAQAWTNCCARAGMEGLGWGALASLDEDTFAWLCLHADRNGLALQRDRAYLAAGWSMARRNDCLRHLRPENRRPRASGDRFFFARSKTGSFEHFLPHTADHPLWCPACVMADWVAILERIGHDGLLFPRVANGRIQPGPLHVATMGKRLRRLAVAAGLDTANLRIGTRSTRIGAATNAARRGMDTFDIARHLTMHKDPNSAIAYIRCDAIDIQFILPTS